MKRSILGLLIAVCALGVLATTASAGAKQVRFVGVHPIAKAHGGGFCHIEAPHVHVWAPTDARLQYRDHDGALYFVGDPVAYGWDGPRHAYYGHHPIHVDVVVGDDEDDVEYCYLDGAHYHDFEPAPVFAADFKVQGDAYWYVGTPAQAYVAARPQLVKINAVYTPIVYERPVVVVTTPPPHWIGVELAVVAPSAVVVEPVVVAPRAHAAVGFSAGVEVHVPAPTLSLEVGLPGVYVGGGARRDVVVIERERGHKHKWKEHRDNGRHRGYFRGSKRAGGRGF